MYVFVTFGSVNTGQVGSEVCAIVHVFDKLMAACLSRDLKFI